MQKMLQAIPRNKFYRLLPTFALFVAVNLSAAILPSIGMDPVVSPGITLTAVGDLIMHMPVVNSAFSPEEQSYDFRPIFAPLKTALCAADISVCVLETSLTSSSDQLSGYPRFNTPYQLAEALRWAGFDLVFTAHNHSLDLGVNGIISTLDHLEAAGLPTTGTRKRLQQKPYHLVEANGIKLAFLSYTTITNGLSPPPDKCWVLNTLNFAKLGGQIQKLKAAGVDGIIMALHYGDEYVRYPTLADQQLCHQL
ncbi:MAG: CapA family protein [Firmicutes bacterium]|nr:CapA family protein [Bacillota bacterium]